jgi:hypothetical protein
MERDNNMLVELLEEIRTIEKKAGDFERGLSHVEHIRHGNLVFMFLKHWEDTQNE